LLSVEAFKFQHSQSITYYLYYLYRQHQKMKLKNEHPRIYRVLYLFLLLISFLGISGPSISATRVGINGLCTKQQQCQPPYLNCTAIYNTPTSQKRCVSKSVNYFLGNLTMDQTSAHSFCNNRGLHLASILSFEELSSAVKESAGQEVWTAADDRTQEGKFVWRTLKTPMGFKYFEGPQPDNDGNEDCIEINFNHKPGLFNDRKCSFPLIPLCEYRNAPNYLIPQTAGDFASMNSTCTALGAKPAMIASAGEYEVAQRVIETSSSDLVYLGAYFNSVGSFSWLTTKKPFVYKKWGSGEPDNVEIEGCVFANRDNMVWNNSACTTSAQYLCEIR
jgi:hypothetical protein